VADILEASARAFQTVKHKGQQSVGGGVRLGQVAYLRDVANDFIREGELIPGKDTLGTKS